VFLLLWRIGLFVANRAYFQLEIPKLQEVFPSKSKSIPTRKNVLDASDSNANRFLSRDTCVSSTAE
jgi:hypothetical protein